MHVKFDPQVHTQAASVVGGVAVGFRVAVAVLTPGVFVAWLAPVAVGGGGEGVRVGVDVGVVVGVIVGVAIGVFVGGLVAVAGTVVFVNVAGGGGNGCVGVAAGAPWVGVGGATPPQVPAHDPVSASQPQLWSGTQMPFSCWHPEGPTQSANDVSIQSPPPKPELNAQQPVGLHDPLSPVPIRPLASLSAASMQVVKPEHATSVNFPGFPTHNDGARIVQLTFPLAVALMHGAAGCVEGRPHVEIE